MMTGRSLITIACALAASAAAHAAGGVVFTAGEHAGYSRVVASAGASDASLNKAAKTVDIRFPKDVASFNLDALNDARKAHRVSVATKIAAKDGTIIRLQLTCDCSVETKRRSDGALILDIADAKRVASPEPVRLTPPAQETAAISAQDEVSLEQARTRMIELLQRAANDGLITIRKESEEREENVASGHETKQDEKVAATKVTPVVAAPAAATAQPCLKDDAFAINGERFEADPLVEISLLQAELATVKGEAQRETLHALAEGYLAITFGDEALALFEDSGEGESLFADLARVVADRPLAADGPLMGARNCAGPHALWQAAAATEPAEAARAAQRSADVVYTLPTRLRAAIATQIAKAMVEAGEWSESQRFYRAAAEASASPSADLTFVAAKLLEHEGKSEEAKRILVDLSNGDSEAAKDALLALAKRYAEGDAPHKGFAEDIGALALTQRGSSAGSEAAYREAMVWAANGGIEASILLLRNATGSRLGEKGEANRQARALLANAFASPEETKRAAALAAYLDNRDFADEGAEDETVRREAARAAIDLGLPNAALHIMQTPKPSDKVGALLLTRAALAAGEGEAALSIAAPYASDTEFAALIVEAHLLLERGSAAIAAASALPDESGRAVQVARAAWASGDWRSAERGYAAVDPNSMEEREAVRFALAAYMAGEPALPPAAEAALVKHQSASLAGLKALFAKPDEGPIVQRLKELVGGVDADLKLIEEMRDG